MNKLNQKLIKKCRYLYKANRTKLLIRRILNQDRIIKLELGAGCKKGINGWLSMDTEKITDLYWDLRNGIPFPDNSVDIIYASHVLEHFSFDQICDLIKECRRVLIPKGIFSLCVPNASLFIKAYVNGEKIIGEGISNHYFEPAYYNTGKIDIVNYIAYMCGQHKYMFDEENLINILLKCGFRDTKLRPFNSEIDLEHRKWESIYAIAEK